MSYKYIIDIKDNTSPAYNSPVMKKYSITNYNKALNDYEDYRGYIQKALNAGLYVIGRITVFKDSYFVNDHKEVAIKSSNGEPFSHNGSYWPTAFNRYVWQFNVELAREAVEELGFNEIQFDYVRFPDRTTNLEKNGTINLKNNANVIIKANSSNCGIIFFNNNSTESVKLGNSSKLYIQNGVSVFSDNGAVIGLESTSSLFLHKGKVININAQNPKSIYSNTATTSIYIGIEENANELYNNTTLSDGDIIISTEKGLPLMTYGKIYWKAGLLKTSDIVNKSGYNDVDADGRMKVINTKNTTINSCLYYDSSENKICAKLGARNWEFCDGCR